MEIFNVFNLQSDDYSVVEEQIYTAVNIDQTSVEKSEFLLNEHYICVTINNKTYLHIDCTPTDLVPLVVGRLFSEGYITSIFDVKEFSANDSFDKVSVFLNLTPDDKPVFVQESLCVVNNPLVEGHLATVPDYELKPEWIYSLAKEFEKDTNLHIRTSSTHSSFLAHEGKILFSSEDIGRHNAIDKVIGKALISGVDLTKTLLFTSGRAPSNMVAKAIHAKIPVFISKTVPTKQAIELANRYNLTIVGNATSTSFKKY